VTGADARQIRPRACRGHEARVRHRVTGGALEAGEDRTSALDVAPRRRHGAWSRPGNARAPERSHVGRRLALERHVAARGDFAEHRRAREHREPDERLDRDVADHPRFGLRAAARPEDGEPRDPEDPRPDTARGARRRQARHEHIAVDGAEPHEHRDDRELRDQHAPVRRGRKPRDPSELGPRVVASGDGDREQAQPGQPREARNDDGQRLARPRRFAPAGHERQRDEAPRPRRSRHRVSPVDRDGERHVAPVGGVTGEADRQRDAGRDEQDEGLKRAGPLGREQQGDHHRRPSRREDLAEVGARQDARDGRDARPERRAAHRLGSHEKLGPGRHQKDDEARRDPAAKTGARDVEIGRGRRREQETEHQAADRRREAQQDESPDERGDHLTRKEKLPSLLCPSRATTFQNTR